MFTVPNVITRNEDIQLLIAIFRQWENSRIDSNKLAKYLDIRPGAANMRLQRFGQRLEANLTSTNADRHLLFAIMNQKDSLPNIDSNRLGADLGINPRAAGMRWFRFRARLEAIQSRNLTTAEEEPSKEKIIDLKTPGKKTKSSADGNDTSEADASVIGWPYNEAGWLEDEA